MRHAGYGSPAVILSVSRGFNCHAVRRLAWGIADRNGIIDRHASRLREAGYDVHPAGDHVLVTPGRVDVEGEWRRARESTRVRVSREHAPAAERIANRDARRRARQAREAARRNRPIEGPDLAAFAP